MRTCPDCQNNYEDEILHCPEDGYNLTGIEPQDELVGRAIGSYRVEKLLGKGGMGAVYKGVHPVIGSKVAIKFLHPQYATDQKIVDRFFNEARAVNVIGHDNILKILDLNITEDNRHYFIMEFLQGKALQAIVKPNQPVPLEVAGSILLQCCNALQAAHDKGIIHRDLKPDNVYLISHNGRKNFVKVVDFGIAKLTDPDGGATNKTQTGMVMGTPAYMSPEQGSGETNKIDGRSDIYSLGVMMFQMATGKLPFPGSNFGEVLMGHLQRPPPSPRELNPDIPEDYEAVILKTLEKRQEDRYQSMAELREAIFNVLQAHGLSAELPLADETEELPPVSPETRSNPGARTPSRPNRTNPPRTQGARGAVSNPRMSQPGRKPTNPPRGDATQMVAPPGSTSKGLLIGAGVAVLVLAGATVAFVARSKPAPEPKPQPVAVKPAEEKQLVFLSVISEPLGADVEYVLNGEKVKALTPFNLEVPRMTKLRFEFKKDGFAPFDMQIVADSAQTITASLKAVAVAAVVPVTTEETQPSQEAAPKTKKPRREKKQADAPAQKDGLIDLGDAFK